MRHQHLINEAKQFEASLLETKGELPQHIDVLNQLARARGADNWSAMVAAFRPNIFSRLAKVMRGDGQSHGSSFSLDELLYPEAPEDLQLGACMETGEALVQGLANQCRHMLVVRTSGSGAATFVRDLAAQQLVRGGGLLVVERQADPGRPDPWKFADIARLAKMLRRPMDEVDGTAGAAPDLATMVREQRVVRFRLPAGMDAGQAAEQLRAAFEVGIAQMVGETVAVPFMVLADASLLGNPSEWSPTFLAQASARWVSFVMTTEYGSPALEPQAQNLHAYTWTKAFFKATRNEMSASRLIASPRGLGTLDSGEVAPSEELLALTDSLRRLGVGEYLLVSPNMPRRTGRSGGSLARTVRARNPRRYLCELWQDQSTG